MAQKLFAVMVAFTLTTTWLGVSAAQQAATGQVLRVATDTVLPDKLDTYINETTQVLAAMKGLLWFTMGYDAATKEFVSVMLWNNQADLDAFVKSDARKAAIEKVKPLVQGESPRKNYPVVATKSPAPHAATGQVLRVSTGTTVLPDKLDTVVNDGTKLYAATKGQVWFTIGYDAATKEMVFVHLWNSQADIDAFVKSDARKAAMEKMKSLSQGEPSVKNYPVVEAKK